MDILAPLAIRRLHSTPAEVLGDDGMTLYWPRTPHMTSGEKRLSIAGRRHDIPRFWSPIRLTILCAFAVLTWVYGLDSTAQPKLTMKKVIVAYVFLRDREPQTDEIAVGKLTRINYAAPARLALWCCDPSRRVYLDTARNFKDP